MKRDSDPLPLTDLHLILLFLSVVEIEFVIDTILYYLNVKESKDENPQVSLLSSLLRDENCVLPASRLMYSFILMYANACKSGIYSYCRNERLKLCW